MIGEDVILWTYAFNPPRELRELANTVRDFASREAASFSFLWHIYISLLNIVTFRITDKARSLCGLVLNISFDMERCQDRRRFGFEASCRSNPASLLVSTFRLDDDRRFEKQYSFEAETCFPGP